MTQPTPSENDPTLSPRPISRQRLAGIILGPLVAVGMLFLPAPEGMSDTAWRMAAIAVWMVIWWLSEAVPLPATALLPLVLMPILDVRDIGPTASSYANPLIFLFLGGFLLAAAMQKVGLHRRIALRIVSMMGTTPDRIVLGFMVATAFLSMWISNTATAIMMYAVALSVIAFVGQKTEDAQQRRSFGVALMLAIAYSASIGGVATLIGTPPNALLASFAQENYGIEISFARWMMIGLPITLVMLPVAWLMLTRLLFSARTIETGDAGSALHEELASLGRMGPAERWVAIVFAVTAGAWILREPITIVTGLPLDDAMIAIAAALALFSVPIRTASGEGRIVALDWEATRDVPWGILILFGGGLALAGGFGSSGLARWIGEAVGGIDVGTLMLVLLALVAMVYMTEITSNTASTATFLPILGAVAVGMQMDVLALTIPVALGASMAFMMPVATPPNAIVFAYREMRLSDMVRAGFLLNLVAIAVAFGMFVLLGGWAFGIEF